MLGRLYIIRWHCVRLFPVVHDWYQCGFVASNSFFGTQLVPLCLKVNLSPLPTSSNPPLLPLTHPLYAALMIFCAMSEKDSEKPANLNSRYLYDYLLVAIALLCFSCKSYVATVRHRIVMLQWIFQLVLKYLNVATWLISLAWSQIVLVCKQYTEWRDKNST